MRVKHVRYPESPGAKQLPDRRSPSVFLRRAGVAILNGEADFREILDVLPAAVYVTDPEGRIIYYNAAAAALWGQHPVLGESRWCGSWKLFSSDGSELPHDQCSLALALKDGQSLAGSEAEAERPDGTRVPFMAYPTLLYGRSGVVIGAVNMLVDITERKQTEEHAHWLAAIVASSEDAIVSKNLDGIITTWNQGAERLFGYKPDEVVGQSVTILIPIDRHDEEPAILARIRRGEVINHYETVRRRKDGSLLDISLTVSPIKNAEGRIIGVSKIARDITERRKAEERQQLLIREMAHRVKNLFAVASGVVSLSARFAGSADDLARAIRERLGALSRAHSLTLPKTAGEVQDSTQPTTLHTLIRTIMLPYEEDIDGDGARVSIHGPDVTLGGGVVTNLALLVHEFATNAVKYGALSMPNGTVEIASSIAGDDFTLAWTERGGPAVGEKRVEGFGTYLGQATIQEQLGGVIFRDWSHAGLTIHLKVARDRLKD
jgi:PAS domain S-box-containing protein